MARTTQEGPQAGTLRVVVGLLLAAMVLGVTGLWWICRHSDTVALLPSHHGAEWIVYPKVPEGGKQAPVPLSATFRHSFFAKSITGKTTIRLCAYKVAALTIN